MRDLRFRPVYRLRKTDEYSSVFAFRRAIRGDYFVLHFRTGSSGSARMGVVVAKKLARQASQRNLVKRLVREHFRHIRETLPGYDVIVRLNRPIVEVRRSQLRRDIASVFGKLGR